MGGTHMFDPAGEGADIHVCDFGDHEIVVHDYLPDGEDGSVHVRQENGTDWSGSKINLQKEEAGSQLVLEDAEGNPGPPGPMYVEDATVTIDDHFVDAQRTQRL